MLVITVVVLGEIQELRWEQQEEALVVVWSAATRDVHRIANDARVTTNSTQVGELSSDHGAVGLDDYSCVRSLRSFSCPMYLIELLLA
jgi:hypothetical protein